ncbi:MAG TPA: hypothetical protein DIS90_12490 [Cytophagales bacterium]|nr:hypothetical protein [Cytophagales bacterium]HCR54294.1 hypothetical protein [Cytophagales bacterium]
MYQSLSYENATNEILYAKSKDFGLDDRILYGHLPCSKSICRVYWLMAAAERNKGVSTRGYFKRAKAFGYLMLIVAIGYLIYYLITEFS